MPEFSFVEIYGLYDPSTNALRYVGKANCHKKRLKSHLSDSWRRNTPVCAWIRSLGGVAPTIRVLARPAVSGWKEEERRLIAHHRAAGADLLNVAPGGNEPYCPKEVRARNGARNAKARVSTDLKRQLYTAKHRLGILLRKGHVSDELRGKMRKLAADRPDLFAEWANV